MFGYQESANKERSGWYYVENGEVIVYLKKSGALEAEKYVVRDGFVVSRIIKQYIETGKAPDFSEVERML